MSSYTNIERWITEHMQIITTSAQTEDNVILTLIKVIGESWLQKS